MYDLRYSTRNEPMHLGSLTHQVMRSCEHMKSPSPPLSGCGGQLVRAISGHLTLIMRSLRPLWMPMRAGQVLAHVFRGGPWGLWKSHWESSGAMQLRPYNAFSDILSPWGHQTCLPRGASVQPSEVSKGQWKLDSKILTCTCSIQHTST